MRVVISLLCLILLQSCFKSKSEDANIVSEKSIEEPVHAGLRLIEKVIVKPVITIQTN